MQGRFEYVKFDEESMSRQELFKEDCVELEKAIKSLPEGNARAYALKALEEMYMWIGKAVRDEQLYRTDPRSMDELMGGV